MGCEIEVEVAESGKAISVKGNSCPRGKMYAENEVVCPVRVVTSTVRAADGQMIPVKTDKPVKKSEMFDVMKKINAVHPNTSVKIGDVLQENIADGVNLVATGNYEKSVKWIIR
jgi:CxxC motif-containing protein